METMTEQPAPETAPQPEGFVCPHCKAELTAEAYRWRAGLAGKGKSEKKAAAARLNAKKPRPRKPKPEAEEQA